MGDCGGGKARELLGVRKVLVLVRKRKVKEKMHGDEDRDLY